jgi:hypothetical protein
MIGVKENNETPMLGFMRINVLSTSFDLIESTSLGPTSKHWTGKQLLANNMLSS